MILGKNFRTALGFGAVVVMGYALPLTAQVPGPVGGGDPAAAAAPPVQPIGVVVDTVVVRGNQRIDAANIRVVSSLPPDGSSVTNKQIETAIRRLMETDQFDWVDIYAFDLDDGGLGLYLDVQERPFIASFAFEGLERVSAGTVRDTVGLTGEQPLRPQLVLETERRVRDLLGAAGVQLAGFDTAMVAVPERPGVYRLTFQVEEGNRLAIAELDFVGNEAFSDEDLRGAIATREEGFLWFRSGKFDRETFQTDLMQTLPEYYGAKGYIDFAVVSDTMVIDPVTGKARIEIAVNEGEQYRLGDFTIQGARHFPIEQLKPIFTARGRSVLGLPFGGGSEREAGEIFDRSALQDATRQVYSLYRNDGYLTVTVEPLIERREDESGNQVVDVTWSITEGSPVYVNTISIVGNTFTHESVIRDRIVIYPGDVFSDDRYIQSYRSIAALGFFETPLPEPEMHQNLENNTIDLVFRVEEKQTGSINFGTSIGGGGYYGGSGGLSGFLGYSQPNLFGQAKQIDLQAEYGYGRSSFTASYTDPALLGSRNSGSISVYHTDDRYRGFSFSDGRYVRTGGALRYGFPVGNLRWTRAFAGYSLSKYRYEAREAEDCQVGSIFCQPSALASNLSLAVTRDTKDHPMFPTQGTRQNITVQQTGGILGGDGNFQKVTGEAEWWVPVGQIGGSAGGRPIVTAFGFSTRFGTVFGDATRFPLERFFLGGTQFGQALRGYEESTVTPFGYFDRNDPVITSSDRLGDAFLVVGGEYAIRVSDGISISAFAEGGNIWSTARDINPAQLYRSAGVGATVVTPFGPLGVDMAYGFDRTEPGWKFHFKINQPGF